MCSERVAVVVAGLLSWSVATLAADPADPAEASAVGADGPPVRLEARPDTCVALYRGETCFKRIRLSWSAPGRGRFCLLLEGVPAPLVCWSGNERDGWTHAYASATGERYRLVSTDADGVPVDTLATTAVDAAWVYRGRRRGSGGWRLF